MAYGDQRRVRVVLQRPTHRWRVPLAVILTLLLVGGCTASESSSESNGPQPIPTDEAAAGPSTEEVVVPAEGLDLVGTLERPEGPGPHPTVVIVHGSGPADRDGTAHGQLGLTVGTPIPVYAELATGLVEAGYATFRWDKRTCGPFNDCGGNDYPPPDGWPVPSESPTFDTFVADADAVIDHLGDREDIGPIAVLGHSKGGTVAIHLADGRDDLASLLLVATPNAALPELLRVQAETLADLIDDNGTDPGTGAVVDDLHELADEVAAIADGATDGPPVQGASRAYWASWADAAASAPQLLERSTLPVLVLGGEQDWNVPPDQVHAWDEHLSPDSRIEILPDLTHILTRLSFEGDQRTPTELGTQVDDAAIDAAVTWLDQIGTD